MRKKLVLATGEVFYGNGFGSDKEVIAELVFETSMVGYQEILSEPAYAHQMVCMSYPLIGNYGLTDEDYESKSINLKAMIVREYNDKPSNFRFTRTLDEVMKENDVVGICDCDTRSIVKHIRDNGVVNAMICDIEKPMEECLEALSKYSKEDNLVEYVSTKRVAHSRTPNPSHTVVCIDCGLRTSTIKKLNGYGCNVVAVPYKTSAEEIMRFKPDGLLISNGPGNPNSLTVVVETIKELKGKLPILAIGLGLSLVGLSYGAKVEKMAVGHHGSNIAIKNINTKRVQISNQNHLYNVVKDSVKDLVITHYDLVNGEVEGLSNENDKVIAVNYNPEFIEVNDDYDVVDKFIKLMEGGH